LIFVTVGAQMPFDRLIEWVDAWAVECDRSDVRAQIGPSSLRPRRVEVLPFMDPPTFRSQMEKADAVVAHAGMGTILTALELGKPILVVPRLGNRGETRNDHQVATAKRLAEEELVIAVYEQTAFAAGMEALEAAGSRPRITGRASDALLARLREFVLGEGG
jgi:UDP-N-acetylglucosamine transferase subunit ALG13